LKQFHEQLLDITAAGIVTLDQFLELFREVPPAYD